MCAELEQELERGRASAKAIVAHMEAMGGAGRATMPVSHVTADGRLQEWTVTVELKAAFAPPHDKPQGGPRD